MRMRGPQGCGPTPTHTPLVDQVTTKNDGRHLVDKRWVGGGRGWKRGGNGWDSFDPHPHPPQVDQVSTNFPGRHLVDQGKGEEGRGSEG